MPDHDQPQRADGSPESWSLAWAGEEQQDPPTGEPAPELPVTEAAAHPAPDTEAVEPPEISDPLAPPTVGAPSTDHPLNPPPREMPDSPALIPPHPLAEPTTPRAADVYRPTEFPTDDHREGPAARPPRSRYTTPLPASQISTPPKRTRPSRWATIVLPFLSGIIGAALVIGGFLVFQNDEGDPASAPPAAAETVTIRETVRTEFVGPDEAVADPTAVARKVIPSVVTVEVGVSDGSGGFNGTGSGSGVVLSADGYIVTNEHVVDGSDVITVSFSDGRLYEAELLGADAVTDLAVLKIEADGLVAVEIGSTEELEIGDTAIAAGSPLGLEGGPTVTVGVISAFDREVQTGPAITDRLLGMLQTDAQINRGSSGGALVDARGALIGVTSAVGVSDVGVEGIGFAIPIEVVQRITEELIENGEVVHSFLGIEGRTSFEDQFDGAEVAVGVFIQAVVDDTGASAGGIQEGDIIVSIAGKQVKTINSLVGRLRRYKVGEPIDIEVIRAGDTITLTIELGPRPENV